MFFGFMEEQCREGGTKILRKNRQHPYAVLFFFMLKMQLHLSLRSLQGSLTSVGRALLAPPCWLAPDSPGGDTGAGTWALPQGSGLDLAPGVARKRQLSWSGTIWSAGDEEKTESSSGARHTAIYLPMAAVGWILLAKTWRFSHRWLYKSVEAEVFKSQEQNVICWNPAPICFEFSVKWLIFPKLRRRACNNNQLFMFCTQLELWEGSTAIIDDGGEWASRSAQGSFYTRTH